MMKNNSEFLGVRFNLAGLNKTILKHQKYQQQ